MWLHYAELVLGSVRGHTAIANTSIPVGAFNTIFALAAINLLVTRFLPSLALRRAELIVIYVMTTVATVLSSSGGLHFLIPTLTAAHYFATSGNGWGTLFHEYIPKWLVQADPSALDAFYKGNSRVPWGAWMTQIGTWMGFLFTFAAATLCISILLRKQWVESEKLPFPTVTVPLELTREGVPIFRDRLFWIGTAAAFLLGTLNTLHLNMPNIPQINVRGIDLAPMFQSPPWNAIGFTPMAFFPFAIGIGFLLSTEVAFSCWFFYLVTKAELIFGAASGMNQGAAYGAQSTFPYLAHQGAGAFLGLAISVVWLARRHLLQIYRTAFPKPDDRSDDPDAATYRWAFLGLAVCFALLVAFAVLAGTRLPIAILFMLLVLLYLLAATRIRAETGNAWPVGPDVDGFRLMTTAFGTHFFTTADLTALTYIRSATAGQDFRGMCMPHELDGLKMADSAGVNYREVAWSMLAAVAIGVSASFVIALVVWNHFGALAKTDAWRSYIGMQSFTTLEGMIKNPKPTDWHGMGGVAVGGMVTAFLASMRVRYSWWPFHPVGYAMANTATMAYSWMPFFVAWLAKNTITRAGGLRLYRKAVPFFLGLIAGDFLHGGLYTLIACFSHLNVYPANW